MKHSRVPLPTTSALTAFECAARHTNFSRAAEELNTSQPAISRHIADLEARLGVRLFERTGRTLRLTEQGEHFQRTVAAGIETIRSGMLSVANWPVEDQVTIACTHEISHLYLMPRYEALQAHLGDGVRVRVLTGEYETLESRPDPRADILFVYGPAETAQTDRTVVFKEQVHPVCAPGCAAARNPDAAAIPETCDGVALLELTKQNHGWATWADWFAASGLRNVPPNVLYFDNYVYLLEAAAAGRGVALGWHGLVERHLEAGALVPVWGPAVAFPRGLHAVLTPRGRGSPAAREGFDFIRQAGP